MPKDGSEIELESSYELRHLNEILDSPLLHRFERGAAEEIDTNPGELQWEPRGLGGYPGFRFVPL